MPEVLVVGGGIAGQGAALLLAADGHRVTLIERDPSPPPASPDEAWQGWERRGVNQFRLLHYFLPRFRQIVASELPELMAEFDAFGLLRHNPMAGIPEQMSGGWRDGDERFELVTGRRPVVEAALARVTGRTDTIAVRRGVAVRGLCAADRSGAGAPHVVGVALDDGSELRADLVVDACGRRSPLPTWLAALGARAPAEEREDCGFVYYGRHFRSPDGSVPPALGPGLQAYDSVSTLTLPADNGTWGVGLVTSSRDPALRAARDVDVWSRVIRAYPLVAHWLDGEAISGVDVMAKIEDRHRAYVVDGAPVATGVVSIADAWACTNPSVGRGASIGLLHATILRDVLREHALDDHLGFAEAFDAATRGSVELYYRDTLSFDRHRLAEIEAQIAGVPYEPDDPEWRLGRALEAAAAVDPVCLRAMLDVISVLERGADVLARPGMAERVAEHGATGDGAQRPGPARAELLAIVAG